MRRSFGFGFSAVVVLICALSVPARTHAQESVRTVIGVQKAVAVRASDPIQVDGLLTETDWQNSPVIGELLQREPSEGAAQKDAGADVFFNITPSLNLTGTVNTDFAETEVDNRQINLTRFPLFFPEKRVFFLENAGVFNFGSPPAGGAGGGTNCFHSLVEGSGFSPAKRCRFWPD
jgi:hypothetical protein